MQSGYCRGENAGCKKISILKLAIYEILYKELAYKIAINEAVELAKKYGEDQSPAFINGILASVLKEKA